MKKKRKYNGTPGGEEEEGEGGGREEEEEEEEGAERVTRKWNQRIDDIKEEWDGDSPADFYGADRCPSPQGPRFRIPDSAIIHTMVD